MSRRDLVRIGVVCRRAEVLRRMGETREGRGGGGAGGAKPVVGWAAGGGERFPKNGDARGGYRILR
jgi:hypothetical protein